MKAKIKSSEQIAKPNERLGHGLLRGVGTTILHSSRFILVDRQGQTRGYYDGNVDGTLQKLRRDIKALLRSNWDKGADRQIRVAGCVEPC
ncbi:hypothetical protein HYR99_06220 [Candidatus Poribacteria bacterium]|nr:hypothetical protein [Candidatus Poribacteria bacterium]